MSKEKVKLDYELELKKREQIEKNYEQVCKIVAILENEQESKCGVDFRYTEDDLKIARKLALQKLKKYKQIVGNQHEQKVHKIEKMEQMLKERDDESLISRIKDLWRI